jgi:hypothetical protein
MEFQQRNTTQPKATTTKPHNKLKKQTPTKKNRSKQQKQRFQCNVASSEVRTSPVTNVVSALFFCCH